MTSNVGRKLIMTLRQRGSKRKIMVNMRLELMTLAFPILLQDILVPRSDQLS